MAEDLNVRERVSRGKRAGLKLINRVPVLCGTPAKCILCGRCVRICEEVQNVATIDFTFRGSRLGISPAMNKPLNFSNCISCGQCLFTCPTGAITEKVNSRNLINHFMIRPKKVIVQYSPTVAVSIAEEFGLRPGKDVNGLLNAALRKIGFDKVFDTSFGADIQFIEQAEEFLQRLESGENLPLITGCCPSWIKYAEQNTPLPFFPI
jgi:NADH-quinone oxidoreductase subunit G